MKHYFPKFSSALWKENKDNCTFPRRLFKCNLPWFSNWSVSVWTFFKSLWFSTVLSVKRWIAKTYSHYWKWFINAKYSGNILIKVVFFLEEQQMAQKKKQKDSRTKIKKKKEKQRSSVNHTVLKTKSYVILIILAMLCLMNYILCKCILYDISITDQIIHTFTHSARSSQTFTCHYPYIL